jgi:hypothetical protein
VGIGSFFSNIVLPRFRHWHGTTPFGVTTEGGRTGTALHRDADRNSDGGISAVEQVIAIVNVVDVDVVGVIPVIRPVPWPGVNKAKPITTLLEAGVSANDQEGQAFNSEPMAWTKVSMKAAVRDSVATIAATLLLGAMF